mmetsp:Transcript_48805/g.56252  ORF Transcript_48805/g.56252 Transcript_48805/m.56252 type:complete len:152 (-) Transcript_48805:396-851(-)
MSEKKRVTLVVDPKLCQGPNGGSHDVFNFSGFQQASDASLQGAGHYPVPVRGGGNNTDNTDDTTSYQAGRKSIVEGVGAADLLHMHRKSLAQLRGNGANDDGGGGAPVQFEETFTGVTLSRRHQTSQQEYDAGRDAQAAQELEGFSFGVAE